MKHLIVKRDSYAHHLFDSLVNHVRNVPLPQAVIVFSMVGLLIGHLLDGSFSMVVTIMGWLSFVIVVTFGLTCLYLLKFERRGYKVLMNFVIIFLMVVTGELFFNDSFTKDFLKFLVYSISTVLMVVIFFVISKSYKELSNSLGKSNESKTK